MKIGVAVVLMWLDNYQPSLVQKKYTNTNKRGLSIVTTIGISHAGFVSQSFAGENPQDSESSSTENSRQISYPKSKPRSSKLFVKGVGVREREKQKPRSPCSSVATKSFGGTIVGWQNFRGEVFNDRNSLKVWVFDNQFRWGEVHHPIEIGT